MRPDSGDEKPIHFADEAVRGRSNARSALDACQQAVKELEGETSAGASPRPGQGKTPETFFVYTLDSRKHHDLTSCAKGFSVSKYRFELESSRLSEGVVLYAERGQLGYKTNFNDLYTVEEEVGKGAFGTVSRVVHMATAQEFACKSIAKNQPGMDAEKQQQHLESVQREIFVLQELRSCLNVAKLEEVFESDTHVHIVQELCQGGELEHSIGKSHYSERTV